MRTRPLIDSPASGTPLALWRIGRMCLTGAGQIMLQKSAATGAIFLLGIALNSPIQAFGAVLGLTVATLTAVALRYDTKLIEDGIYGFNGALIGVAACLFFTPGWRTFLLAALGAAVSALAMRAMMHRFRLPPLTAAFVLITWLTLAGGDLWGLARNGSPFADSGFDVVGAGLRGIGQVMFQDNVLSGAVFLVGIAVCSRRAALVAIIGSAIGCIAASAAQLPAAQVSAGLFGYNSVLAALALRAGWPAVLGAVLAVPFTVVMQKLGVAPLTAPFLLATWTVFTIHRMTTRPPSKQKAQ